MVFVAAWGNWRIVIWRGNNMQVSVAMCTYNGARFLQEQLYSINSQSRLPDELVICDDGSTDNTLAILRNYADAAKFPLRIYNNKMKLGAAKNFELAISISQGNIVILSDQDDIWQPNKIQVLVQVLSENLDAGYVFSDAIIIEEGGRPIHQSLWKQLSINRKQLSMFSHGVEGQLRVLLMRTVVTGATMAFRASLKNTILPIPDLWVHDEWISFASSMNGARGIPIQEPLIYYRRHPAQAIGVPQQGFFGLLKRGWKYFLGDAEAYDYYQRELRKWDTLYVLLKGSASPAFAVFPLLEAKVAHVALRAKLYRRPRTIRLAAIIAELISRRYHLYSSGWKSAIKDFLVPTLSDSHAA